MMSPLDHCRQPKYHTQKEHYEGEGDHTYFTSVAHIQSSPTPHPLSPGNRYHYVFDAFMSPHSCSSYYIVSKEELGRCVLVRLEAKFQSLFCDQRGHYYGGTTHSKCMQTQWENSWRGVGRKRQCRRLVIPTDSTEFYCRDSVNTVRPSCACLPLSLYVCMYVCM